METESILDVIEFLSVQQINTCEINGNTKKIIKVKEAGKSKKIKLNYQFQRIPLRNAFETVLIEKCQDKPEITDEDNSILPSFDHCTSRRRQKGQSAKHHRQPEAYITNNQHEEQQNNGRIVPGKRTYVEATKISKEILHHR